MNKGALSDGDAYFSDYEVSYSDSMLIVTEGWMGKTAYRKQAAGRGKEAGRGEVTSDGVQGVTAATHPQTLRHSARIATRLIFWR